MDEILENKHAAAPNYGSAQSGTQQFVPQQPAGAPVPQATTADAISAWFKSQGGIRGILDGLGFRLPGWGRVMLTVAVVLGAAALAAPLLGSLVGAMVVGMASLTTSAALLSATYWFGVLLAMVLGCWALSKVAGYFLSYKVDKQLASVRNEVAWALTPDPKPQR